jgi:hypothetical protein
MPRAQRRRATSSCRCGSRPSLTKPAEATDLPDASYAGAPPPQAARDHFGCSHSIADYLSAHPPPGDAELVAAIPSAHRTRSSRCLMDATGAAQWMFHVERQTRPRPRKDAALCLASGPKVATCTARRSAGVHVPRGTRERRETGALGEFGPIRIGASAGGGPFVSSGTMVHVATSNPWNIWPCRRRAQVPAGAEPTVCSPAIATMLEEVPRGTSAGVGGTLSRVSRRAADSGHSLHAHTVGCHLNDLDSGQVFHVEPACGLSAIPVPASRARPPCPFAAERPGGVDILVPRRITGGQDSSRPPARGKKWR